MDCYHPNGNTVVIVPCNITVAVYVAITQDTLLTVYVLLDHSYTCTHQRSLCLCGSELRDELANIDTDNTCTTLLVGLTYFGQPLY